MRLLRRLIYWWRFRAHSAEIAEEIAFHKNAIERDAIARGGSSAEAHAAAQRAMGNETFMREEARRVWLWPWLEGAGKDAKATLRGLQKSPVFTAGVILTFALGVGANTAMFSLIDRLMFRPPPMMRDPSMVNRVYLFKMVDGVESERSGQFARFADLVRWTTSFSTIAAYVPRQAPVGSGQDTRDTPVGVATASFFSLFDAPPAAGRYFTDAEDGTTAGAPNGIPVAVLAYATWEAQYGRRSDAIGSHLQIGADIYEIIGVAPKGFVGLSPLRPPALFIPVGAFASSGGRRNWATNYGTAIGIGTIVRRKPGVSVAMATAELTNALTRSYINQASVDGRTPSIAVLKPRALAASILVERGPLQSTVARITAWLGGVALIVLLIACANVANLLLARALARRREIAMRIALGVSRARLATQLLTESVLLAVAGSAVGLVLAVWISRALSATLFPGTEQGAVISDSRTLLFAAIVTLAVGAITGVLPLRQTAHFALADDLRSGGRSGTRHRSHARIALIVLQGALSFVLLIGAGLFVRSVRHVRDVRIGFDADSVLLVQLTMRGERLDTAQKVELRERLLAASITVPGVAHASRQESVPFAGASSGPLFIAGIDSVDKFGEFDLNDVSPDYFATMGTRILRGRGIDRRDRAGAPGAMVVGASMAAVLWPGEDAIGKCVRMEVDSMPCTYVVGIAEDVHTHSIGSEARYYYYYLSSAQHRPADGGLFVRARGDARQLIQPLRRRLQEEMPGASYVTVTRLADNVEGETRSWVMGATLFSAFGVLALLLAAVGLYSVIAYDVAQRRQELAVRVALGALATEVVRLVVAEGLRLALLGVLVGGALAAFAAHWVAPLLFKQAALDPVVFGAVAVMLLIVAAAASGIPAIRGAQVDPNVALRAE